MNHNLALPFYLSSGLHPKNLALYVDRARFSYAELADLAGRIAAWLAQKPGPRCGRVGILASRNLAAYAGILGTLWVGDAYVPIDPRIPEDRLLRILDQMELDALIIDQLGAQTLSHRVLERAPGRILSGPSVKASFSSPAHRPFTVDTFNTLPHKRLPEPVAVAEDALAYIIFTSGSTGTPKGVMIETGSVAQYCKVVQERCAFRSQDRVSQVAEITFDNSVLDMFVTWAAGASLHVVPKTQLLGPAKFIRDHALTIWFAVPSIACIMERMKMLKPGVFPSLRCSIFAGEALPIATAQAWQAATPNGVVENFYGPTEVTVDCTAQRLDDPPNVTKNRGSLAIGKPFPGIEAGIVAPDLKFRPQGSEGELVVSGRQLARGYFNDPEMTAARFPTIEGRRWYRTGDLAYQDESGAFHYLGRVDNQVKVLGNRIELEEVEAHLREIVGTDSVAAVAWPLEDQRATGLVAFHCAVGVTHDVVREGMKKRVPNYMVPQQVHRLDELPLGSTGKVDRKALLRLLDKRDSEANGRSGQGS